MDAVRRAASNAKPIAPATCPGVLKMAEACPVLAELMRAKVATCSRNSVEAETGAGGAR